MATDDEDDDSEDEAESEMLSDAIDESSEDVAADELESPDVVVPVLSQALKARTEDSMSTVVRRRGAVSFFIT